jgi:hypothetical protein
MIKSLRFSKQRWNSSERGECFRFMYAQVPVKLATGGDEELSNIKMKGPEDIPNERIDAAIKRTRGLGRGSVLFSDQTLASTTDSIS